LDIAKNTECYPTRHKGQRSSERKADEKERSLRVQRETGPGGKGELYGR